MANTNFDVDSFEFGRVIRSNIQPRNVVIQRSTGLGTTSGVFIERSSRYATSAVPAILGAAGIGVSEIKFTRDKEKRDMQDLNERFASYIEKVRFLEAQNRKLGDELDRLKLKWGKETNNIKLMYQTELDEAKKLLDDSDKEKQKLQMRVSAMEEQIDIIRRKLEEANLAVQDSRDKVEKQIQQLADYEAEVNLLKRRIVLLEGDREINKKTLTRLQDALNRAKIDLDNESLLYQDAENRRQMLEEELEFLKQVHEQELRELAAIAYRDTTTENRELWKSEMSSSLRQMQQLYDDKVDEMRKELDSYYTMKVQEFRTGATRQNLDTIHTKEEMIRLKSQYSDLQNKLFELQSRNELIQREIDDLKQDKLARERELETENEKLMTEVAALKAEMESITKELQDLLDAKLGLELEIAAYRKLLEGEEDKIGLKQVVDSMFTTMTTGFSGGGGGGNVQQTAYETSSSSKFQQSRSTMGSVGGGGGGGAVSKSSVSSNYASYGNVGGYSSTSNFGSGYGDTALNVNQVVKGDMLARTTYQRSAKGPIAISESSPDGTYICLENTGRRDENLGNWTIRRIVNGNSMPIAHLPSDFKVSTGAKVKIYARGTKPRDSSIYDIELYNYSTFGQGEDIKTSLYNASGEERATQVQKTIYS